MPYSFETNQIGTRNMWAVEIHNADTLTLAEQKLAIQEAKDALRTSLSLSPATGHFETMEFSTEQEPNASGIIAVLPLGVYATREKTIKMVIIYWVLNGYS